MPEVYGFKLGIHSCTLKAVRVWMSVLVSVIAAHVHVYKWMHMCVFNTCIKCIFSMQARTILQNSSKACVSSILLAVFCCCASRPFTVTFIGTYMRPTSVALMNVSTHGCIMQ